MSESFSKPGGGARRSRIATVVLALGLLLTIIGASGIALLSLPEDGTVVLTNRTYLKLDGRLLGHISGSYSKNDLRPAEVRFIIVDQHNWDSKLGQIGGTEPIVDSTSATGSATLFSADLPSSEAYYLFIFSVTPDFGDGYGPGEVLIHWHIWGPNVDYSLAYTVVLLVGVAGILYGGYAGLRLTVKRKEKRKGV